MKIGDKYFLNLQEAVAWLLANNALPFQCNVNYVANTEIAKTAIINPSPAEIKVGALVLFADSKVGTVSGLTSNGFMVGSDYTDIQQALAYITDVAVNASGNLTVTLSDGTIIQSGQIKQISSFSIDASQHLIASFNNGTTQDLGAIFAGNVNVAGNFTANSIIENMDGYAFVPNYNDEAWTPIYVGCVKTGNKLTFVVFGSVTIPSAKAVLADLGYFIIPSAVASKLFPYNVGLETDVLDQKIIKMNNSADTPYNTEGINCIVNFRKGGLAVYVRIYSNLSNAGTYYFRAEETFLLSDSLA